MKFAHRITGFLTAAFLSFAVNSAANAGNITVFAAASLREALDAVADDFHKSTGIAVTRSYAGSSALARQIQYGAPADLFISASVEWMDHLEALQHIRPETRVDLLSNRLVLIAAPPQGSTIEISSTTDIVGLLSEGRIAMALTDAVPAGIYAKAALRNLGLWEVLAPAVAETDNVRAALALVAIGAATLGVVYATDAAAEPRVAIVGYFPPASHPPIIYPAALTQKAEQPAAGAFLDYLTSDAAGKIFQAHGFILKGD